MERNGMNADATDAEQAKTAETAETAETAARSAGGCGCGCGGSGKGSNKLVIAIWVVFLLGFACVLMYTRSNGRAESEKLLNDAYALYEKQDFAGAADLLRRSAELGNPWAQIYYGGCLKNGSGVAADPVAAVEWYRKAAAQNNPTAIYSLGVCYENGEGVDRNLDTALEWYRKALAAGLEDAQSAIIRVEKLQAQNEAGSD